MSRLCIFLNSLKKFLNIILFSKKLNKNMLRYTKKSIVLDKKNLRSENLKFKNSFYLCTRYEEVFLNILLKAIIKKIFNPKENIQKNYIIEIIKILKPKYIITLTDYNPNFYELKQTFPNNKFIFFSVSKRSNGTLLLMKKNIQRKKNIDFMCIWGKNDRNYYTHFLKSKFLVSGSIRNNLYEKQKFKSNIKDIVFISQYRDNKKFLDKHIYYEKKLLCKVQEYCKKNNLKLYIYGCKNNDVKFKEISWFNKILSGENYTFLENKNSKDDSSFNISKKFSNFICFSSSLGFELAARNNKVIFFTGKKFLPKKFIFNESPFLKGNGPIWTTIFDQKNIKRLLDYLIYEKKKNVLKHRKKYIDPYIIHDFQNKELKKKLESKKIDIFH